ncbi:type II toxin-antitoxin system RelE/ParE family toxin [Thiomicrorhabdus xiamenensis]|uniref:Type II toxin-antitoxin system RelE/ParE family toxin n=1 Tax=Thiomicrorhabdus xiamenensis TaxID=2739063 RepID=A0A7D4SYP8_9GAMM|nr:type II toxin-antitoxin system RelE/ParE family toxin [Thiomicrorhabdus xiamenensis]QKI89224.1 type II toxin-antitoxin system RelE/ParE family toxin [Thiomicrorhabdus xiamenensis]
MIEIRKYLRNGESPFDERFNQIKDKQAKSRITARLTRLAMGNAGDHKQLSENLFELRIDVGKGWRVYYTKEGAQIVLLILVGDKPNQKKDIKEVRSWLDE